MNKPKLALLGLVLILPMGCQTVSGGTGVVVTPGSRFLSSSADRTSASVHSALSKDPQLAGVPIQVDVQNGNVRLSGYVKTIRQSDMAAFLASKAHGVKTVENNLIVRK